MTSKTKHPLYAAYRTMITRCYNKNFHKYYLYGACGITVSDSWLDSFETFLADMGERPKGHTLDRINGKLGYCKENCRWATFLTQTLNTSRVINAKGYQLRPNGRFEARYTDSLGKRHSKSFLIESDAKEYYESHKPICPC